MALFRLGSPGDNLPVIRGDGVILRPADMRDFDEWVALRVKSRAFLTPWEPIWPADDLTRSAFRRRVRAHSEEIERDEAYPLFIFTEEEILVGGVTIGQVSRGVAQTATLGYWMGEAHAGRGYMSRAVRAVAHYSFTSLRLHRLEAACLPHNDASARLLESVGFTQEGYARSYLRINGVWQDHLLYALLENDQIQPARRAIGAAIDLRSQIRPIAHLGLWRDDGTRADRSAERALLRRGRHRARSRRCANRQSVRSANGSAQGMAGRLERDIRS